MSFETFFFGFWRLLSLAAMYTTLIKRFLIWMVLVTTLDASRDVNGWWLAWNQLEESISVDIADDEQSASVLWFDRQLRSAFWDTKLSCYFVVSWNYSAFWDIKLSCFFVVSWTPQTSSWKTHKPFTTQKPLTTANISDHNQPKTRSSIRVKRSLALANWLTKLTTIKMM